MIPGDLIAKLPDAARAKLQLIADLAADALADADAALADRDVAYNEYIHRLTTAWKRP